MVFSGSRKSDIEVRNMSLDMKRAPVLIALSAGGTGGHVIPAAALAGELAVMGYKTVIITDQRGAMIAEKVTKTPLVVTSVTSHMAGGLLGKIKSVISILKAAIGLKRVFGSDRPSLVVGFGGYPSMPAIIAARFLSISYILHEQNSVLGRVNRLLAPKAQHIAFGLKPAKKFSAHKSLKTQKMTITGNPVRKVILDHAMTSYSIPAGEDDICLFIIGGSQGARILSDVVPKAFLLLDKILHKRLQIWHQARPEDVDRVTEVYAKAGIKANVASYFEDIAPIMAQAHLLIARAGASTIAEATVMGRPAVFIPLKIAADNHQMMNAQNICVEGGGWILEEEKFDPISLKNLLLTLLSDNFLQLQQASGRMQHIAIPDAAKRLAHMCTEIIDSGCKNGAYGKAGDK